MTLGSRSPRRAAVDAARSALLVALACLAGCAADPASQAPRGVAPRVVATAPATGGAPTRAPMSRMPESRLPVDELYADGAPGVARDYRVAVFFKARAVQQGASFDPAWRR